MGIKGLNSFFNQNTHLSKDYFLHDTPVIIDGNNLLFSLYFSQDLDCIYGGNFSEFANVIEAYFSSYIACNIKPIVVFDGGIDKSNRKLKTIMHRLKERLSLTMLVARYMTPAKVLPINAGHVFKDILDEIGILHVQADFEADNQVTALANHYKCPVVSEDSDFYIFDLHCGFIRLNSLEPKVVKHITENDESQNSLKCKIYHIDDFLNFFPGINKSVLPLFGTLVGNDYVDTDIFSSFYANHFTYRAPKFKPKKLRMNNKHKKMFSLLNCLKHNNLEESISWVLSYLKQNQRDIAKKVIDESISAFSILNCNLTPIIDRSDNAESTLHLNTTLTTHCGKPLPPWFIHKFNSAKFPSYFVNVIVLHKVILLSQVEDVSSESSYLCSRYVRQILYGILLHHSDESSVECKVCFKYVEEYGHSKGHIKKERVLPLSCNRDMSALPMLEELNTVDSKCARDIMLKVLNEKEDFFHSLPPYWELLIGSIRYWLRNSRPLTREEFVYSIIINLIYFNLLDKETNEPTENDDPAKTTIASLIENITSPMSEFIINKMEKYLKEPAENNAKNFSMNVIHSFSQLQTCIIYLLHLNKLLGSPFVNTELHKFASGILVYNLAVNIQHSSDPDLFISELLGKNSLVSHLFFKLKNLILDEQCSNCSVRIDLTARKKTKKHSKQKKKVTPEKQLSKSENQALRHGDDIVDVYI